ncbi:hypothetical protein P8452_24794 [Trifolium repens]|nr:hypothetical protein P8452_24794 [Trifolium repens]
MKNSKCQNRMDGKHGGRKRRRQGSNELLLKNLYLSCDPYMRIMMTKDTTSGIGALIPGSLASCNHQLNLKLKRGTKHLFHCKLLNISIF